MFKLEAEASHFGKALKVLISFFYLMSLRKLAFAKVKTKS